ncbi:MAG TPA: tRNA (adenosine(37)-N6)-threonylcarbamoyltransferase complex dimerization subunit type 1 TsaB [Flavitalea sp.]|nr:tRNA (adenosine(37)-N6)-threonylcarbamoyltransferase complex dimerization subunit type 1 TsaB [Flavitalea sp.]
MPIILNIDTSGSRASIALAEVGKTIAEATNSDQRDHASWIHSAIRQILDDNELTPGDLSAIAVTLGPGSYTGLRVGLATAKGFCYALDIPLITENTLHVMAFHAISHYSNGEKAVVDFYIPMIDARRMEVFTAVYDRELNEILHPTAMILEDDSFTNYLTNRTLIFGSGAAKFQNMAQGTQTQFKNLEATAADMSLLSYRKYLNKSFSDIVYCDPLYLKEFYSPEKKS